MTPGYRLSYIKQMRNLFKVDTSLCVACRACVAACTLENGMGVKVRNLYTVNESAVSYLPLFTISLACNHCETASCLNGCPANAYYRDQKTGAVIIDSQVCIGCGYCTWNCPYGAPVLNDSEGFIEKCTFCNRLISDGLEPACSNACPTGALAFFSSDEDVDENYPPWFPQKEINPSLIIGSTFADSTLQIVPEPRHEVNEIALDRRDAPNKFSHFWSLALFTLSVSVACGVAIASLTRFSDTFFPVSPSVAQTGILGMLTIGWVFSLFHLKRKKQAWRALLNISDSPLSREIVFFLLFGASTVLGLLFEAEIFTTISGILALLLLITVDSVYTNADKRNTLVYHSGQLFLSGFTIAAVLSGMTILFYIVAIVRVAFSVNLIVANRSDRLYAVMIILRVLLLILLALTVAGIIKSGAGVTISLLLAGEVVDRFLYYLNFKPLHIFETYKLYLNHKKNEKTGD